MVHQLWRAARSGLPAVSFIVPAGRFYRLVGEAADSEWTVAEGVSTGRQVAVCDPAAPPSVPTTYRLNGVVLGTVRRLAPKARVLTSLSGRGGVDFVWQGTDSMEYTPRLGVFQPLGSAAPVVRYPLTPAAASGSLVARTVGAQTRALRELVGAPGCRDRRRPLILVYDVGVDTVPESSTPPVRFVHVTSASEQVSARRDRSERVWELQYTVCPPPQVSGAELATWGEAAEADIRWGASGTWLEVMRRVAGGA